jgi:ribonuclease VapC
MIVVDTSALIAILDREPDAALYAEAIAETDSPLISAATLLELHIVMLNRHGDKAGQLVDRLIQDAGFQIEHFTAQHLELAREAYGRYGKGRNSAGLNYGEFLLLRLLNSLAEEMFSRAPIAANCQDSRRDPPNHPPSYYELMTDNDSIHDNLPLG